MSDATNVAGALAVSEAGVRVGAAVLLEGVTARFAPGRPGLTDRPVAQTGSHTGFRGWRRVLPALSVALIWPLHHVFGDWRVMLWSIMAQWGASLVLTHLVAERRRYSPAARRSVLGRTWPVICDELIGHYDDVLGTRGVKAA